MAHNAEARRIALDDLRAVGKRRRVEKVPVYPVSSGTPPAAVLRDPNGDAGGARVDAADGVEPCARVDAADGVERSPGSPAGAADLAVGSADPDGDPRTEQPIPATAEEARLAREQHWDATLRQAARVSILMADPAPSAADREQRITDLATLHSTTASNR